jgi:hypothetical protein
MAIEIESEQQRYQNANEAREQYAAMYPQLAARRILQDQLRNADLHAAGLERRDRWQYRELVRLTTWSVDIADFPKRIPQTTIAKPVILSMKMQRSLTRRNGLVK